MYRPLCGWHGSGFLRSPPAFAGPSSRTTWSTSAIDDFLAGQSMSSAPSLPLCALDGAALAHAISHEPRQHGSRRSTVWAMATSHTDAVRSVPVVRAHARTIPCDTLRAAIAVDDGVRA